MDGFASVVIAVISTVGGVAIAWIKMRPRKPANGADRSAAAAWRGQAELEKARADLLSDDLEREKAGRIAAELALATTRHDYDDCVRQRDDAFSDLRLMGRTVRRRTAGSPRD